MGVAGWFAFGSLRAYMDDFGMPVHSAGVEPRLFGSLPSAWLQAHVYELSPGLIGVALALIHVFWFAFPWLIAFHVTYWRRELIPSLFMTFFMLWAIALPAFALFPLEPPWMASADVERVLLGVLQTNAGDGNQLAAMPSMHVAFPLVIGLWAVRRGMSTMATLSFGYALLVSGEVVISGEHYVVDVIGAVILAVSSVTIAEVVMQPHAQAPFRQGRNTLRGVSPAESGQNLVEFAFISPLLILMIAAIIMVALGLHTRSNLQQAVREGARQAAVGKSLADVRDLAAGNSGGTLDSTDINWCLPGGSAGSVGDQIRVYVDDGNNGSEGYGYTIIPATGIFSAMGVSSLTVNMSPRATARLEKSVSGIPACT
jgi:hypothetical protein